MILTGDQIKAANIVSGDVPKGWRTTTYDATVGTIVDQNGHVDSTTYKLLPRGIVWVVSAETFSVPNNSTGLATLKTTWTREGVLALTLGVVDPGWDGPLGTAIVNFSAKPFMIKLGDPFFRMLFLKHKIVAITPLIKSKADYIGEIQVLTTHYSDTFLTLSSLTNEISEKLFSLPRWVVKIGIYSAFVASLAILMPVAWNTVSVLYKNETKIIALEKKVCELEKSQTQNAKIRPKKLRPNC